MNGILPELLSPAGSMEALKAAIDGGADAIYMGGASFSARMNAENFDKNALREAVRLAHAYGVKLYQTINTMVLDRERDELLRAAEDSARQGIDAFIVSDLGAASLLHGYLPELPLHASTQMSIHNSLGAEFLKNYGFTRVVPARELSREDIFNMVKSTSLEVEMFVHGALCVSHSGQCLFSSLVGGRSGNRGLCAQPCRLPYACDGQRVGDRFPLSLKDLSLAEHIEDIIACGVASLKIEGRMKSPEYVRGVTAIWRRLLDDGKNADISDMRSLAEIFSRGGFTDAYYKRSVGRGMLGVRSEDDKHASREAEKFNRITRKVPIDMLAEIFEGERARLTLTLGKETVVTVEGDMVQRAVNAPISRENVERSLCKLGDTPFSVGRLEIKLGENVMLPISALNSLRRTGAEALTDKLSACKDIAVGNIGGGVCENKPKARNVGRFYLHGALTDKAREFFDVILLPLNEYCGAGERTDGFWLPEVIFDSESLNIEKMLAEAKKKSPEFILISNLGQIDMIKEEFPSARLIADFRFNIGNRETARFFETLGFESYVASAELTMPQLRDLDGAKAAIVYGRVPLMLLEKCVICELYGKKSCEICARGEARMKDRRGFVFPILRTSGHRNIVFNSLPTDMSDRQEELVRVGISDRHFIFTVETGDEVDRVIDEYVMRRAPHGEVRRI